MPIRTVNLQFPLGGVNRSVGYQSQPPYTTFDAMNVRPDGTLEGRARGGSRPGLSRVMSRYSIVSTSTPTMIGTPSNTNLGQFSKLNGSAGDFDGVGPFTYGGEFVTSSATLTYNPSTNTTNINRGSGDLFLSAMVGGEVIYADSKNTYTIASYTSPNAMRVVGDSSGESTSANCIVRWTTNSKYATLKFDTSGNIYDVVATDNSFASICYILGDATGETNNDTMVLTIGSETETRMLGTVRESVDAGVYNLRDKFNYTVTEESDLTDLSDNWFDLTDANTQDIPIDDTEEEITGSLIRPVAWPSGFVGTGYGTSSNNNNDAASGNAYVNLSHSLSLSSTLRAVCIPSVGPTESSVNVHYLYAWMDNTTPDPWADGLSIWTYIVGGPSSSNARRYIGVTERSGGSTDGSFQQLAFSGNLERDQGLLVATIVGQNVTVRWVSHLVDSEFTYVTANAPSTSNNRIGIGIFGETCNESGGILFTPRSFVECPKFSDVDFNYRLATGASYRQRLLASTNNSLYASGGDTTFAEINAYDGSGTAVDLADQRIYGVEMLGRFWIADDEGVIAEGDGGTIASSDLDDSSVSDWTVYGLGVDNHVCELFNHDNGGNGTYGITAVASGDVTLGGSPPNTSTTTDWRFWRAPKIYDPVNDKMYSWYEENRNAGADFADLTEAGTMPVGCPLIARYNGRIFLAGNPTARHVWYACRQSNPLDWDYSQDDVQAALAATSTEVDVIGDPLTALIPYLDDYLIFACADSLWQLRGDPTQGGRIINMSQSIGCIGARAWCHTDKGELFFMARNGMYYVAPGASSMPQEVSESTIPGEFQRLSEEDDIQMAYDQEGRGIHIFIKRAAGGKTVWWWDQDTRGFWPVSIASDHFPSVLYSGAVDEIGRNLTILGGEDSYLRAFSDSSFSDDGLALNAYVFIGPFRASSGGDTDGMVKALVAVLGEESGDVAWELYAADTAEGVTKIGSSSYFDSGTWSKGRNYHSRSRSRGGAFALKISSTATPVSAWSVETVTAKLESLGMLRIL